MNKLERFTNIEIKKILNDAKSFKEAIEIFGYSTNGSGSYSLVSNILNERNIEKPTYFIPINEKLKNGKLPKIPLSEILIENSKYASRTSLKKRLINEGVLEYKCRKCGNNGEWEGKPLSLQLEHKNGVNNDNRINNLEFLCPNCHSQSKTFSGRNRKMNSQKKYCKCGVEIFKTSKMCISCRNKILAHNNRKVKNRPNIKTLLSEVKELGYRATGKKYGVSDNAVRNWLK